MNFEIYCDESSPDLFASKKRTGKYNSQNRGIGSILSRNTFVPLYFEVWVGFSSHQTLI